MNRIAVLLSGGFIGGLAVGAIGMALLQPSHKSPYVDQADSPIPGLSAQEIDDLRQGRGAGYARTAELNSYPGPRHVLDLKADLDLSPSQEDIVYAVFEDMQRDAQHIGKMIVDQEDALSRAFATATITPEALAERTQELAALYSHLRATHLEAHVAITPLLSAEQIEQYDRLRGYAASPSGAPAPHSPHRH
ncbi:MAG: Spy/CpxP family protein refolding chaperone [Elainellaceae cyanobacterium]